MFLVLLFLLSALLAAARDVRGDVELHEEGEQRDDVDEIGLRDADRVRLAVNVDEIQRLRVHADELNHLAHGEGRLPPDVIRVHRHEVVRVHDGVDEAVQHDGEINIAVIAHVHIQPVELQKNNGMHK